jgi:hypothetical protein
VKTDEGMKEIGKKLEEILPTLYGHRMGFALIVFPFGKNERTADYISNAKRADMIRGLRETADKIEGGVFIGIPIGEA